MINIALGLGSLVLLVPINNLILNIAKYKPHLAVGVPGISMFVNAIIVLGYGLWLKPYTTDSKLFIGGLLLAVFTSMVTKLSRLLKNG